MLSAVVEQEVADYKSMLALSFEILPKMCLQKGIWKSAIG